MNKFIIAILLTVIPMTGMAVCASPITRTDIGFKNILTSSRYNADVNTAYNRTNNLPGDCIEAGTITAAKIANGAVTGVKIADGAITAAKLATGAIPEAGRLIRVSAFTSSGTWTKQSDVGFIMIQVVGGGGASYHASATNGGASSFGSHCTANGGSKPASGGYGANGGAGGTASNGDINLTGGSGDRCPLSGYGYYGFGGVSMMGHFGAGGIGSADAISGGGGAGGYCAKIIARDSLNATETVTIGAGGTNPVTSTQAGLSGIVIVYEYSK